MLSTLGSIASQRPPYVYKKYNTLYTEAEWQKYDALYAKGFYKTGYRVGAGSGLSQNSKKTNSVTFYSVTPKGGYATLRYLADIIDQEDGGGSYGYVDEDIWSSPYDPQATTVGVPMSGYIYGGASSGAYWYADIYQSAGYYKGSTLFGTVKSTNQTQYPDNGHLSGNWYVKTKSGTASKGSYLTDVGSDSPIYPSNGVHSDGYWYELQP